MADARRRWRAVSALLAIATLIVSGLAMSPAKADTLPPVVVDQSTVPPYSYTWAGVPAPPVADAALKLEPIANAHPDVFAGLVFADRFSHVDVYVDNAQAAAAHQLIADLNLTDGSYQVTVREHSRTELLAIGQRVAGVVSGLDLPVAGVGISPILDGAFVELNEQPSEEELRVAADILGPEGVVKFVLVGDKPAHLYPWTIGPADVHTTPGLHFLNGREWRTECGPYSQTTRCFSYIKATIVREVDGRFVKTHGWAFNVLTYEYSNPALWKTNPLGHTGQWTATDGRRWRTVCDTPVTGDNACRSFAWTHYIASEMTPSGAYRYHRDSGWVLNNIVRFGTPPGPGAISLYDG